jgi:hypothetical protein
LRSRGSVAAIVAVLGCLALPAAAQTLAKSPTLTRRHAAPLRRHAAYIELLGKGGLWGLGYDFQLLGHVAIGGTASAYTVGAREQVFTLSPYLTGYLAGSARHRWFMQIGPQIVHLRRASPVPEWPGQSSTGLGGELSTGYELRGRVLLRLFVMGAVGRGGAAPWLGMSLGFTL